MLWTDWIIIGFLFVFVFILLVFTSWTVKNFLILIAMISGTILLILLLQYLDTIFSKIKLLAKELFQWIYANFVKDFFLYVDWVQNPILNIFINCIVWIILGIFVCIILINMGATFIICISVLLIICVIGGIFDFISKLFKK